MTSTVKYAVPDQVSVVAVPDEPESYTGVLERLMYPNVTVLLSAPADIALELFKLNVPVYEP